MKKIVYKNIALLSLILIALAPAFYSCERDSDGSPDVKAGNPVFESITPAAAQGGELVVLKGSGLGDMVAIIFEKDSIPASFMTTLNTEKTLLFRVPADAVGGSQNISFINSAGKKLDVTFNVLAYPQVFSVSNYNFETGTRLTLTGTNLADVSNVKLTGTADNATIVSKTKTTLVIDMPATTVFRATLDITNITGKTTTTQEFVSITNNFICYAEAWGPGAYNSGVQSWSWGCSVSEVSDQSKSGTKSLKVAYADGGLSLFLGSDWADPMHVFTDWFAPTYISFWAKGDGKDVDLRIIPDSPPWDGTYSGGGEKKLTVPKDVWTYFKFPSNVITGKYGRLNVTISGMTGRTVYFDDFLYVK